MGSSPPRLVVSEHAPAAAADTGTRAAPRRPLAGVPDAMPAGALRIAAADQPGPGTGAPATAEANTPPRAVSAADYWTQGYASRIRLRVFRPERRADDGAVPLRQPGVLYLHGGGFV
ncbi:alpha/beta hydrolase, partial [Ralstonia pseudosolanacearum]